MADMERHEEWKRLADAATAGPWIRRNHGFSVLMADSADARFIAAAREAVPALIAALSSATRQIEEARSEIAELKRTDLRVLLGYEAGQADAYREACKAVCPMCREMCPPLIHHYPDGARYQHKPLSAWIDCAAAPIRSLMGEPTEGKV
jgi:hypothetical protein